MDIPAALFAARNGRTALAVPGELQLLSVADAYALQDALVARREAAGARVTGWKLGITSAIKQEVMGIDHPLYGRLFDDGEVASGSEVRCDELIAPRTEPEIAFALRGPLVPGMSDDELLGAVEWLAPALEITDSRYAGGRRTAVELIADNTSAAKYVLGKHYPVTELASLRTIAVTLSRNGTVLATGTTADVLGDPLRALSFLAEHLQARGLRAEAGSIVMSGAITDAFPVSPGDAVDVSFGGLASAEVRFI